MNTDTDYAWCVLEVIHMAVHGGCGHGTYAYGLSEASPLDV